MRWPTGTEVALLRQRERCYSKVCLGVQRGKERAADMPPPLMVGHHYALAAGDTYDADEHTLTFGVANFLLAGDIRPNMTLAVGTLADPFLYGSARIREVDVANNRLNLEPNNLSAEGYLAAGDYIWGDGVYRLYRKLPYIVGGTVYEDGNPDTLLGASGIPGYGIPFSVNHLDRPCALMGSPRFAWRNEPLNFYGWRSHGRGGWTIGAYLWDFDGGIAGGAGVNAAGTVAAPVTATWGVAGEYISSLLVTDNSGKAGNDAYGVPFTQHRAVRPVLVFDRPGEGPNPPYAEFEISSLSGRYGSGWTARITVFGTADKSEFPDNAMIIVFAEDWYGGTKQSIGGWYGQEGILFTGHIRSGSVTVDSEKSTVSFQADTIEQWAKDIDEWPANCVSTVGAPTRWHEFQAMTVEDVCWYLGEFRSNLKDVTDCFFCSDPDGAKTLGCVDITEASLYDQISSQLGSCFFGQLSASRHGSVHISKHKNMLDLAERVLWGPPIYSFQKQDWHSELEVGEERQRDSVAQIDFIGFIYNANLNPQEVYSLAPERQTNFGTIEKVDGILLSGNTIALAQPEANTLSGLYRAWKNIRIPSLGLSAFDNRVPEPATLDYFAVELDAADTIRGYNWAGKEFLCTGVSLHFDHEKGTITADVEGEESTWGPDGVAGPYPPGTPDGDPPDEPPEYWGEWPPQTNGVDDPPPWAADITEYIAYFVTGIFYGAGGGTSSGHVIRATNARSPIPGGVIYEDLGLVDVGGLRWIALDEFDPENKAMVCGPNGVWSTTNLNAAVPVWTLEIAIPPVYDPQYGFTMVRSSPVQDGVWMAVCFDSVNEVRVYWTINDGLAWNNREIAQVDCVEWPLEDFPYLELSSHDVNKAWVSFDRWNDGLPHVVRTGNLWTSAACFEPVACFQSTLNGYEQYSPMHHRYADNPTDQIADMGGRDYPNRSTRLLYATSDLDDLVATCVNLCTVVGDGVGHGVREIGCFRTATNKWWALVWCYNVVRFMTVVGGVWVTRYSWPRLIASNPMMLHASGCRENADWFYLTEDGTGAFYGPLWVSFDGGASWQRQTGNWNALCIASGWTAGNAPIIHCVAPVWTV